MPERIQRQRTKGWRMPEGAIYVGRPSKWGNWLVVDRTYLTKAEAHRKTVGGFREISRWDPHILAEWLEPLRGRNLVCWCPLDQPCHADVLLELANGGNSDAHPG